jgi:hypothetical protein
MIINDNCRDWKLGNGMRLEDLHVAHKPKWNCISSRKQGVTLFEVIEDHCRNHTDDTVRFWKENLLAGRIKFHVLIDDPSLRYEMLRPLWLSRSRWQVFKLWVRGSFLVNPISFVIQAAALVAFASWIAYRIYNGE